MYYYLYTHLLNYLPNTPILVFTYYNTFIQIQIFGIFNNLVVFKDHVFELLENVRTTYGVSCTSTNVCISNENSTLHYKLFSELFN